MPNGNTSRYPKANPDQELEGILNRARVALSDGAGTNLTSTLDSGKQGLDVNISSADIAFSGTEYTENDVDTTITGIAQLAEGPSDTLRPLQLNSADDLLVNLNNLAGTGAGRVQGADNEGDPLVSAPFCAGGQDIFGDVQPFTAFIAGSLYTVVTVLTDSTGLTSVAINNQGLQISGTDAHDTADASNPIKGGFIGYDDKSFATDITASRISDMSGTLDGLLRVSNLRETTGEIDIGLDTDVWNATTTRNSDDITDVSKYRYMEIIFDMERSGNPGNMRVILQGKDDAGNYYDIQRGPWMRQVVNDEYFAAGRLVIWKVSDVEMPLSDTCRFRFVAGSDASNTYTMNKARVIMGT